MSSISPASPKKTIGCLCSYVPEELIMAAGHDAVRLQGQMEKMGEGQAYLSPNFCPYLQNLLDSGLSGKFNSLEGIVFTNSCDGMRRLYDLWGHYVKMPFFHMLEVPKHRDERAIEYFAEQLRSLKIRLEEALNVRITDDKLWEAIDLMNDHRRLILDLFERQKGTTVSLKGSDLFLLCLEEVTSPKNKTTEKLHKIVESLGNNPSLLKKEPRLLVVGNVIDRLNLFKVVEETGASVVAFDTCVGLRHYSGIVEKSLDPIYSLARSHLLKPPCARMLDFSARLDYLRQLINDYAVDGIIYSCLKYCDNGMFEAAQLENSLVDSPLTLLVLESDYLLGDQGRVKTRIEAFIEMIKG